MELAAVVFPAQKLQRLRRPLICCCSQSCLLLVSDELLSSQEKTSGMKDVIVSIDTSKDSDGDSSKLSSKATSLQNSPATQKGRHLRLRQRSARSGTLIPQISFTPFVLIQQRAHTHTHIILAQWEWSPRKRWVSGGRKATWCCTGSPELHKAPRSGSLDSPGPPGLSWSFWTRQDRLMTLN